MTEFKTLVRALHKAGIKVILDVVYNHSGEGNELGPSLPFEGVDNRSYYCLTGPPDQSLRYYMNYTGCGNSLNFDSPAVIRLVMDSLRYWAEACTWTVSDSIWRRSWAARRTVPFKGSTAPFFEAVRRIRSSIARNLIAEPWDIGIYQVGNFPVDWSEWNGRFRDTVRQLRERRCRRTARISAGDYRFGGSLRR